MALTLEKINNMKHCIGFEQRLVKRGKYEAYRNYYNTGDEPDSSWEQLVAHDFARQFKRFNQYIYCLSEDGFRLLEDFLDVKIVKRD